MLNKKTLLSFISVSTLLLTACGEDSTVKEENQVIELSRPIFSLAISDAPVEALSEVVVCFNQVELKGGSGDRIFTVGGENGVITANDLCLNNNGDVIADTVGINLLDYTGSDSIALVEGLVIDAGEYSQLRLVIADGSYGIDATTGDKVNISIPSNELKLDGFSAVLGGTIDFTLEFDLRNSMTNPVGQNLYFLKPRGVRLVDNNESGHLKGSISEAFLSDNQCTPLADDSESIASIYLYEGSDIAIDTLADNGGSESTQPLASAAVTFNAESITYNFAIGFISTGDYTIAVSCDTTDDPESDDIVTFIEAQNVTITAVKTPVEVSF